MGKSKKASKSKANGVTAANGNTSSAPSPTQKTGKNSKQSGGQTDARGSGHTDEVDPDLIHSKWSQKLAAIAKAKESKPKSQKAGTSGTSAVSKQLTKSKKRPAFEFLVTPHLSNNLQIENLNHLTRLSPNGQNIVYFNRQLHDGETLSLHAQSFSKPDTINMKFGLTTCNPDIIRANRCHAKSFCQRDGRPCNGLSVVFTLDRSVRGSEVIAFKKVPEGVNFLSDGFLVTQFKDTGNIFKQTKAYPFIALTGDIDTVTIVESDARTRRESQISYSIAETTAEEVKSKTPVNNDTTSSKAAKKAAKTPDSGKRAEPEDFVPIEKQKKKPKDPSDKFSFIRTPHMHSHLELLEKNRLVIRKTFSADHFNSVFLNRELEYDRRLVLQVEKVNNMIPDANCFSIGVTTCDPEKIRSFSCHSQKTCWNRSECGGVSTSFNILKAKTNSQPGTIVTMEKRDSCIIIGAGDWFRTPLTDNMSLFMQQKAFPFVVLNGSVCGLRIIEDPERFAPNLLPVTVHRPLVTYRPEDHPTAVAPAVHSPPSSPVIPQPVSKWSSLSWHFVVPNYGTEKHDTREKGSLSHADE